MMSLRLPQPKTKARFLMIGYGLLLLFWMSLENSSILFVTLLGIAATLIYGSIGLSNRIAERDIPLRHWFPGIVLSGTFFGVMSIFMTSILMFFKSSWHGHLYPDYPPQMIFAMLPRLPAWTLSGTLIGIFCAIFIFLHQSHIQKTL